MMTENGTLRIKLIKHFQPLKADLTKQLKYFAYLFQRRQHHAIVLHFLDELRNPRRLLRISILHRSTRDITYLTSV